MQAEAACPSCRLKPGECSDTAQRCAWSGQSELRFNGLCDQSGFLGVRIAVLAGSVQTAGVRLPHTPKSSLPS